MAYTDFTPKQIWRTRFLPPKPSQAKPRENYSLTQNTPRRVLLGVVFAYADFTPPQESYVPYITEGVKRWG